MKDLIIEKKVSSIKSMNEVQVGHWFWVKNEEENWFGCVMEIGSNYVELHSPHSGHQGYHTTRIHFDDFFSELIYEPNAQEVIDKNVQHYQNSVKKLLAEVKAITAKLGVSSQTALPQQAAPENQALAVLSNQNSIKEYETALILAKDKQLPDLFKAIKKANENLATWLSASSLPLEATISGMGGVLGKIQDRVFNVSLYAGLTEQVIMCGDGKPADFTEKLHIMQRRLYMDEECLLDYQVGGMDFQSIAKFDEWICKPLNRDRILPFPRCLVAMKVRRLTKEREGDGTLLRAFINIQLEQADRFTFLYIRNGDQLYRLDTDLEFDEMIFPDRSLFDPGEEKMFKMFGSSVNKIISKNEYDEIVRNYNDKKRKYKQWNKDNPEKTWDKSKGSRDFNNPYRHYEYDFRLDDYHPFNPSSVYYDDVTKMITDQITKYNRIVLIIQGLFDRSPILHPHPPVRTWSPEGFNAAVKLIYDGDSSVLYGGEKPDFEAYRKRCNESINKDSILIGQELYWMGLEAQKENERQEKDWRIKHSCHYTTYKPYGNPGPGLLAKMSSWKNRSKQAIFKWERKRLTYNTWGGKDGPILCSVTVPVETLFNVSAYSSGDYKQFFQDPRTREEYLKWALILLTAEEYLAGNREVEMPV